MTTKDPIPKSTIFSHVLSTIQYDHFLAGVSGGVISSFLLHPFDLVKVRFQVTESKNPLQSLPYRPRYNGLVDDEPGGFMVVVIGSIGSDLAEIINDGIFDKFWFSI
ncbi:unnamed protein product [Didymodactylos carnosus]|uniref:ADP,ATP carrier protein n=1 Tax=Didymodactylos carnosus TaxID=1234261 RepID=A0A8S2QNG3_9BILA|nr:unnamed protein product [Didymodactylos carnosus]CAF4116504.1 unnamed protein product [Didymodactylos carnosus]